MSVLTRPGADRLPADTTAVPPSGLLARVRRPCPDHAGEAPCVGRHLVAECLVFWCERGEHHFTVR